MWTYENTVMATLKKKKKMKIKIVLQPIMQLAVWPFCFLFCFDFLGRTEVSLQQCVKSLLVQDVPQTLVVWPDRVFHFIKSEISCCVRFVMMQLCKILTLWYDKSTHTYIYVYVCVYIYQWCNNTKSYSSNWCHWTLVKLYLTPRLSCFFFYDN